MHPIKQQWKRSGSEQPLKVWARMNVPASYLNAWLRGKRAARGRAA